jgi:hypothetical protein
MHEEDRPCAQSNLLALVPIHHLQARRRNPLLQLLNRLLYLLDRPFPLQRRLPRPLLLLQPLELVLDRLHPLVELGLLLRRLSICNELLVLLFELLLRFLDLLHLEVGFVLRDPIIVDVRLHLRVLGFLLVLGLQRAENMTHLHLLVLEAPYLCSYDEIKTRMPASNLGHTLSFIFAIEASCVLGTVR